MDKVDSKFNNDKNPEYRYLCRTEGGVKGALKRLARRVPRAYSWDKALQVDIICGTQNVSDLMVVYLQAEAGISKDRIKVMQRAAYKASRGGKPKAANAMLRKDLGTGPIVRVQLEKSDLPGVWDMTRPRKVPGEVRAILKVSEKLPAAAPGAATPA